MLYYSVYNHTREKQIKLLLCSHPNLFYIIITTLEKWLEGLGSYVENVLKMQEKMGAVAPSASPLNPPMNLIKLTSFMPKMVLILCL